MTNKETDLYRFYSSDEKLLYIGISFCALRRFMQHRKEKPWSGDVKRIEIETYATRTEAEAIEKAAIKSENPLYNVVHNNGGQKVPDKATEKEIEATISLDEIDILRQRVVDLTQSRAEWKTIIEELRRSMSEQSKLAQKYQEKAEELQEQLDEYKNAPETCHVTHLMSSYEFRKVIGYQFEDDKKDMLTTYYNAAVDTAHKAEKDLHEAKKKFQSELSEVRRTSDVKWENRAFCLFIMFCSVSLNVAFILAFLMRLIFG